MLYPSFKFSSSWSFSAAVQLSSRPYFFEQFDTQGYGTKSDILRAHLTYARYGAGNRSVVVRLGQLSSAFGSFLLRYDDAVNPLLDMPASYGYYYKPVTSLGLTGAQVDVTAGRVDARAQFVNSSPSNRRSVFDTEQYGNWAGGAGVTIRQGFRVGASAFRGPYLHRQHRFYRQGEAHPRSLPGTGYGVDVEWGSGHWNAYGEFHRFVMDYRAIPVLRRHAGYGELRRVLHPRWYVAARLGYDRPSSFPGHQAYEFVVGYRPNRLQLLKAGYQVRQGPATRGSLENSFGVQLVTSLAPISIARH
jgi:hypothetical protein